MTARFVLLGHLFKHAFPQARNRVWEREVSAFSRFIEREKEGAQSLIDKAALLTVGSGEGAEASFFLYSP